MIEQHPDFSLTPHALELLDPEIREDSTVTRHQLKKLAERTDQPLRDFEWQTAGKKTKISDMDIPFLLVAARHCIHRANFYHEKVAFFMDVLDIVEEHAHAKGIEVPETVEEVQALLEGIQKQNAAPLQSGAKATDEGEVVVDEPDKELLERLIEEAQKQKA